MRKQYSDGTSPVAYAYDTATAGKGKLASVIYGTSGTNGTSYGSYPRACATSTADG